MARWLLMLYTEPLQDREGRRTRQSDHEGVNTLVER